MPKDRDRLDIRVPYLAAGIEYDGQGLSGFPERKGFVVEREGYLTFSELRQRPAHFAVAFVQAWLYFGLLQEVLGEAFSREDFISRDPSDSCDARVSTTALLACISGM